MELHVRAASGVTYRPSPVRVGCFVAFALLGIIPITADGVSVVGRAAGWLLVTMAPLVVGLSSRTWVRFSNGAVEVGRVVGTKRFVAGQASVRRFGAPGGLVGDGSAVCIEGTDGCSVSIALGLFRSRDQLDMVRQLRATLKGPA